MRKMRAIICVLLAVLLGVSAQAAQYSYAYEDYTNLLGSMEVVNVKNYTWLKDGTGAFAGRLCKVPAGAVVTNCYYYDNQTSNNYNDSACYNYDNQASNNDDNSHHNHNYDSANHSPAIRCDSSDSPYNTSYSTFCQSCKHYVPNCRRSTC